MSWAPSLPPFATVLKAATAPALTKRFASAGSDNVVRIWGYDDETKTWSEREQLSGHSDWVRDVAWAPNIGMVGDYIATASQDKTVLIHYKASASSGWTSTALKPNAPDSEDIHFADTVWRVSWSLAGNILAVSCGDGKVTLWKESVGKGWECVSEMNG